MLADGEKHYTIGPPAAVGFGDAFGRRSYANINVGK
jgi:hypothetical protein